MILDDRRYSEVRHLIADGDLLLFRRRWWVPHSYLIAQAGRSVYSHAAVAAWWPGTAGSEFALPRTREKNPSAEALTVSRDSRPGTAGSEFALPRTRENNPSAEALTANSGSLFCLEMLQFRGGRAVLLSNRVGQCPGRIDVYRPDRGMLRVNSSSRDSRDTLSRVVETMKRLTGKPYGWMSLLHTGLRHLPIVRWIVPTPVCDRDSKATHLATTPPYCSEAIARAYRSAGVDPVPNLGDAATEPGDLARSPLFHYQFTLKP